jgi:hypothetical protein
MMGNLVCLLLPKSTSIIYSCLPFAEELLIDFQELIGQHSGENMAEVVWATMELYGLIGKAGFVLDCYRCLLIYS